VRLAILAAASLLALTACADKSNPPDVAPTNVQVSPGDGVVLMTWDTLPDLVYWIFYRPGNVVNAAEIGATVVKDAVTPRAITGLVNDTQYALVMNATQQDSAAGPSSPTVIAFTRLAGDKWTVGGTPIAPQNLNALAFNGFSRYVAVGDKTTMLAADFSYGSQNPLGVTQWVPPTTPPPAPFSDDLKAVIYNGSFVVLGANGSVATSVDGLNWTAQHQVQSGVTGLSALAFGFTPTLGATYFAIGIGGQMYITNDLTQQWTPTSANTSSNLTSISVLNGFLIVTGDNNTLLVSPDGANWTPQATGLPQGTTWRAATFMPNAPPPGNVEYVVVGDGGAIVSTTTILRDSTDTVATGAWTPTVLPGAQNLQSVTVGGATGLRFLAVGQGGAVGFSDDGLIWNTASSGADLSSVSFFTGQYLAVGSGGVSAVSH
jgi:hypothetical protein